MWYFILKLANPMTTCWKISNCSINWYRVSMVEYYSSKILLEKIFASGHFLEINENYRKYAALRLFMLLKRNKLKEQVLSWSMHFAYGAYKLSTVRLNQRRLYDNLSKLNFRKQEYMKRHWIHYFMKEIVLNCPDKTVILIVSPAELIIFNDIKNRRAWWWQAPSNKANPYWWKLVPTKPKSGQLVPLVPSWDNIALQVWYFFLLPLNT